MLLGVSIGEEGVVSGASKDLEQSLRGDLRDVRSSNSRPARASLRIRDDFERQAYPGLVADLLPGFRIGIVAMGDLPSELRRAIRDAVEPAGADIASISVIRAPLRARAARRGAAADAASRRSTATATRSLASASRLGSQLANGGGLVERVQGDLFSSSRGEYRGLDGIVWVRDREGLKGDDEAATRTASRPALLAACARPTPRSSASRRATPIPPRSRS